MVKISETFYILSSLIRDGARIENNLILKKLKQIRVLTQSQIFHYRLDKILLN